MNSNLIVRPIEICLRYAGFWPEHRTLPYLCIIIWIFSFHLIFQYWEASLDMKNIILVMNYASDFAATTLFYMKFLITCCKRRILKEMLAEILTDWENAKEENKKRILAEKQKFIKGFFVITIFIYSLTASFYIIAAIVSNSSAKSNEEIQHFIKAKFPFESKVSPAFEIICCLQIISMSSFIVGVVLVNSLYIMMVLHASARLEIITEEIKQFSIINKKVNSREELLEKIRNVVDGYQEVLSFCIKAENVFSYQIFIEVLFSTLLLCCTGYMFITLAETKVDIYIVLKFLLFLTLPLSEMAVYCYAGEYLRTKSESIQSVTYDVEWYNMNSTHFRALLLIMHRSQKPITLTAGKFMDMSVSNYANILKAAASYLSVLRSIGDKKN